MADFAFRKDPKNFLAGPRGGKPKKGYIEGKLYHVAPTERVEKITKEGIQPQGDQDKMWPKGWRKDDPHTYAFMDPRSAHTHAKRQAERTGEPQSILAVKVKTNEGKIEGGWGMDYSLHDGNRFRDDLKAVKKPGGVPPEDIEDVWHVKKK